jgi:hypothetical protein
VSNKRNPLRQSEGLNPGEDGGRELHDPFRPPFHKARDDKETDSKKIWRVDSAHAPEHVGFESIAFAKTRLRGGRDAVSAYHEKHHDPDVPGVLPASQT